MSFDPLTAAFDAGKLLIERFWPDPQKQAEEIRKLEELRQRGNLAELTSYTQILLAQIKVNEVSAKHPSIFVSGARPAAIWAGVFSMTWSGLIHPVLMWFWALAQALEWIPKEFDPPPLIESAALGAIVTGLLGVSSMRSYDKTKGNNKDSL